MAGFKIADAYVQVETRYDGDKAVAEIKDGLRDAQPEIRKVGREQVGRPIAEEGGREAGNGLPKSMIRHMRVTLRQQKPLLVGEIIRLGAEAGEKAGRELPKSLIKHFQAELRGKPWLLDTLNPKQEGEKVGREAARAAARALRQSQDIDNALTRKMRVAGRNAVPAFFQAFAEAITLGQADFPTGAIAKSPVFAALGTAIAVVLAGAIVSGLGAALIAAFAGGFGLGVIGIGAWLVADEPEVQRAAKRLGDTFGRVFNDAAEPMIQPITNALEIFTDTIERLAPSFDRIFKTMSPVIEPLAEGLSGFLENLTPGLEALARVGADVLLELADELPGLGKSLSDMFERIEKDWPEIKESVKTFMDDTGDALKVLGEIFMWMVTHYRTLKTILKAIVLPPPLLLLTTFHEKIANSMERAKQKVRGSLNAIVGFFSRLPSSVGNALSGLWRSIFQPISAAGAGMRINALGMVSGFVRGIATLPGRAMRAIGPIRGRVAAFFSGAGSWLWNAGWRIISGLVDGIRSAVNSILQPMLSWVTSMIPDWKGPPEKDATLLYDNGKLIGRSLRDGFMDEGDAFLNELGKFTLGMPGMVPQPRTESGGGPVTVNVNVDARGVGPEAAQKVARETAMAIREALDNLDRSRAR